IYRWGQNVQAYVNLLTDPYPPFGDKPYVLQLSVMPDAEHSRLTSFFRGILVFPHLVVLFFLYIAQAVVTVIAWFAILFTGQYPPGFYSFSVGVSRWTARVLAYSYLFVAQYPPFSMAEDPSTAGAQPRTA